MGAGFSGTGYIATYQNGGSNTTVFMTGMTTEDEHYSCTANVGYGVTFGSNSGLKKDAKLILEQKGSIHNDHFGLNARLRNALSPEESTSQLRVAGEVKTNIGNNTTIYADAYVAPKFNYDKEKFSNDYGAFAGIKQKIGRRTSIALEGQRYKNSWGANAILSWAF